MDIRQAFAKSLRQVRRAQGLTQEDFDLVSSRIYLSLLERGKRSPTLDKIDALCETMGVHPLTLLTVTYLQLKRRKDVDKLLEEVRREVLEILAHRE
jgi:transcriptional regulator with XRE-family HTH domain